MRLVKFIFFSTIFIGSVLCQPGLAQITESEAQLIKIQEQVRKWRDRIDYLNSSALQDSKLLPLGEQAFYLALQAKIWWKTDEAEGRTFLKRSGDKAVAAMAISDKKEFNEQLKHFPKTFEILAELDETFSESILKNLEKSLLDATNGAVVPNTEMADLHVSVALATAKANPKFAHSMGKRSLDYGFPLLLPSLIANLNVKDAVFAEELFSSAISSSSLSRNPASDTLLFNLCRISAFGGGKKQMPANLIRNAVRAFVEKLDFAVVNGEPNPSNCGIAFYASSVIPAVDEYLPEFSASFRRGIQTCSPLLATSLQERSKTANDTKDLSVDEMLDLARKASDKDQKFALYRKIFNKLTENKDFESLSSLIDGLDGDDYRKIAPVSWDNWRQSTSVNHALAALESGDVAMAYRIIEKTPAKLRPMVRKEVTSIKSVSARQEFYQDNLNQMVKELNTLDASIDTPEIYLFLAKAFVKITPTETSAMFRNAVNAINKVDADNPDSLLDKDWAPMQKFVKINAELLEIDELSIFSSMKEIDSRQSRLRLTLGFIDSSLPKYAEVQRVLNLLKKSNPLITSKK